MANKNISIKDATDKELDELINRLRKENEVQDLIINLKMKGPKDDVLDPYRRPEVSTEEPVNSLYHYGVLGMRWGVRKRRRGLTPKRQLEREDTRSEDYKKKISLKKKKVSEMSNAELRELNNRLQLEKQYKELTKSDISPGRKFAQDLLKEVGREVVKEILRESVRKGLKTAAKR